MHLFDISTKYRLSDIIIAPIGNKSDPGETKKWRKK